MISLDKRPRIEKERRKVSKPVPSEVQMLMNFRRPRRAHETPAISTGGEVIADFDSPAGLIPAYIVAIFGTLAANALT